MTATTIEKTIPLASCPGLVGGEPTPVIVIGVGDEFTISGLGENAFLTTAPDDLLDAFGTTFVARHEGAALITVHGALCQPDTNGVQGDTCPLLKVEAR